MPTIQLTWLGHATFRFDTPEGKRVYVDPFLAGNPKCPDDEKEPERVDLIALTHAHGDHLGSTIELAQKFGCHVAAPMVELGEWLMKQGLPEDKVSAFNKGGTIDVDGIKVTATDARHSSSADVEVDGEWTSVFMGEAAGLVIDGGGPKLYFAGDTCVFGDMQLIARLYEPDVAILPIGDFYTMGPKEAALALELLGVKRCVPCHYGTFPILHGTPDQLRELAPGVEVLAPEPGETIEL
jgi:L-ascorbate metabolism protein UlaG (beta-lactamase superfamily)